MIYPRERVVASVLGVMTLVGPIWLQLQDVHMSSDLEALCDAVTDIAWVIDPANVSNTILCVAGYVVPTQSCDQRPKSVGQLRTCLTQTKAINMRFHPKVMDYILRLSDPEIKQSGSDPTPVTTTRHWNQVKVVQFDHSTKRTATTRHRPGQSKQGVTTTQLHKEMTRDRTPKLSHSPHLLKDKTVREENSSEQSAEKEEVTALVTLRNNHEDKSFPDSGKLFWSALWPGKKVETTHASEGVGRPTELSLLINGVKNARDSRLEATRSVDQVSRLSRVTMIEEVFPSHPCVRHRKSLILPHPSRCHWYYDCSQPPSNPVWKTVEPLTLECPYPSLFSETKLTCQAYNEVDCGQRTEYKTPCDYRENTCTVPSCHSCQTHLASCVGLPDGVHPFPGRHWSPWFVQCQGERTMLQGRCDADRAPIFSPDSGQCVSLQRVPKQYGGTRNECQGRKDGYHADETGICHVFFECRSEQFLREYSCPGDANFDPKTSQCNSSAVIPPCGPVTSEDVSNIFCTGQQDGFYADLFGRCLLYYECKNFHLRAFLKCAVGAFNPRKHVCDSKLDFHGPCGLRPNPCNGKSDGIYADSTSNCLSSVTCKNGYVSRVEPCPDGLVFDVVTKRCQLPKLAAPPCGIAPTCAGKLDGKYPNEAQGCAHYVKCSNESLVGFGECDITEGGFFFNPVSRECDFPQNICPPCGNNKKLKW
ncbi:chitin binding beak protein 1 [Biomphalaria glabrata]|nr:CAunnamed protein product [Biomphalaria glabrata]